MRRFGARSGDRGQIVGGNPFETSAEEAPKEAGLSISGMVLVRGILGGVVGGVVGFFAFQWLARQGMYGMMIPGASIGLGAGLAARGRSAALGVLCAIAAIGLSIFAEWAVRPFVI